MERSFPFNANIVGGVPDRVYSAEDFAAERASYITSGVLTSDSLTVGAAGGMAVSVRAGSAVIDGYNYRSTDYIVFALQEASELLSRIDTVVLVLDLAERDMHLEIKSGEYSSSPTPPSVVSESERKELAIADINVKAGCKAITLGDITDRRSFAKHLPAGNDITVRRLVKKFDVSGEYTFNAAQDGSIGGRYDIELCGGGGGGGSSPYAVSCGGGGGAGAYVTASVTLLPDIEYSITVGNGGSGGEYGKDGEDGGASSFCGFTAIGGGGGSAGSAAESGVGGSGGVSGAFIGESGKAGGLSVSAANTGYQTIGAGAASVCGSGGGSVFASSFAQSSRGVDGKAAGSGGSGGGGTQSSSVGGNGADGLVMIYGYFAV